MTVIAPPPHDELEALIREARTRQRKRRLLGAVLVAAVTGGMLAAFAVFPAVYPSAPAGHGRPVTFASVSRCTARQLRLGRPRFDGAYTAHVIDNLTFTNTSPRTCALRGWPSLEVVLPGGRRVAGRAGHVRNATSSRAVPTRAVVLRPGGAASFHAVENDGTGLDEVCPVPLPAVRALVIPPGSTTPVRGSVAMPYCHAPRRLLVYLSPVVAGRLNRYIFR